MQPTGRDLRVDKLLTNISIGYKNTGYIADQIFPIVTVKEQSGIIPQYDQSHWFRDEAKLRGPGTKSQGSGYTVDKTPKYYCDRFSFRKEIADDDRQAEAPFDEDRDATEFVTDKLQMKREVAWAADFFKTGVWGLDQTGVTHFPQWSDYGSSPILSHVTDYMDGVEARIGREANVMVLGKQVWIKVKWHPDLIDTIKYTQKGTVSLDLAASLFELQKIHIGRSIYTASPEGTAESSVTYSRVWGKKALLIYVPDRPSLQNPAAGYTFVWNRVPNAIQYIKRMRDEEREIDIIEGNTYFDQKVTGARAGTFLDAVVA